MDDEDQEKINYICIRLIVMKYSKSRFVYQYDELLLLLLLYIRQFSM
jgi:hypothetical protein